MGISHKDKRKVTVNEQIYWWFVEHDSKDEPLAHIIADDHSFIATCSLYCPHLHVTKGGHGASCISIPSAVSDKYLSFTPKYISEIIHIGLI